MSDLDYITTLAIMEDLTITLQRDDAWDMVQRLETGILEEKERRRKDVTILQQSNTGTLANVSQEADEDRFGLLARQNVARNRARADHGKARWIWRFRVGGRTTIAKLLNWLFDCLKPFHADSFRLVCATPLIMHASYL